MKKENGEGLTRVKYTLNTLRDASLNFSYDLKFWIVSEMHMPTNPKTNEVTSPNYILEK